MRGEGMCRESTLACEPTGDCGFYSGGVIAGASSSVWIDRVRADRSHLGLVDMCRRDKKMIHEGLTGLHGFREAHTELVYGTMRTGSSFDFLSEDADSWSAFDVGS